MINSLYYIVSFLLVITLVVFVHEFGHYWAARRAGVKVLKFSIGMGPELFGYTDKRGTRWCFSMIPVGGFVMMLGDEDISSSQPNRNISRLSEEEKAMAFHMKSNFQKMWISFCGPFANYIYAFVVMALIFICAGAPIRDAEIRDLLPEGPAQVAGLLQGDIIKSINGREITRSEQVAAAVNSSKEKILNVVVERAGEQISYEVAPTTLEKKSLFGKKKISRHLGVSFGSQRYEKVTFLEAIQKSFTECVYSTRMMLSLFKNLLSGRQSMDNLGGFVYMATVSGDIAKTGNIVMLLMFTVTLSLNLGFINLLPFPVVDGGNILVNLIEQCLGRPINRKLMDCIMMIGVIALIVLMLLTTMNDILRIEAVNNWIQSFF